MTENFISANPDSMELGKFYRTYTNKDNATLLLPKDVEDALYADVTAMKLPVGQCWVGPAGNDGNEGTISKPFAKIQHALDAGFGLINLLPGTYNDSITLPVAYGQYGPIIAGSGLFESPKSFITGTLTIPAGTSRLRLKNLLLDGKGVAPAIVDNGSDGRHVLENVTVSNPASGGDLIQINNGKNWWNVVGSTVEGLINLTGTGTSAMLNLIDCPSSFLTTANVRSGYTFTAFYVGKLGIINHLGGNVFCSYVGSWYPNAGKIINSTSASPLDVIGVGYSSFTADTVNYGVIASVGATVIKNYNVESPYPDVCLSAVSTIASTLITTTASTLIAGTKKVEKGISYNTSNGELTFLKTGYYSIAVTLKIDCTEWNKKVEMWIEKYNGSTWDIVADTGFIQNFQTDQESVPHYDFASYFVANEKYRLRAVSDSDTTVAAKTVTLTNGVKMPAIRISINC